MKLIDYERHEVEVGDWDPTALEVFAFVRDSLAVALPDHEMEHIGSTSVPGLRGNGIVDVMVLARDDADTATIAERLEALGLQHARGSRPERPFLLGGVDRDGSTTYIHIHVIRARSDEAIAQHGLAEALRNDPSLRNEYASLKQRVVDSGTTDPTDYSIEKVTGLSAPLTASDFRLFLILARHPRRPRSTRNARSCRGWDVPHFAEAGREKRTERARVLEPMVNGRNTVFRQDCRHDISVRVPIPKGRALVVVVYLHIRDHSPAE